MILFNLPICDSSLQTTTVLPRGTTIVQFKLDVPSKLLLREFADYTELTPLEHMVIKVAAVHGEKQPSLHQIKEIFLAVSQELSSYEDVVQGAEAPCLNLLTT